MKLLNKLRRSRGFAQVLLLVAGAVLVMVVVSVIPVSVITNTQVATDYLIGRGYVVLGAGEYESISDKLDALKVSADAAVVNAETAATNAATAVTAAESAVDLVELFNSSERYVFPDNTARWVLFASSDNDTFGAWAEIQDNTATTLSSKFAANSGYIMDMYLYDLTRADTMWLIELSYGAAKTNISKVLFNSEYMDIAPIRSKRIPSGETIYYRMMANCAPTEYVSVGFRYIYE